MNTYADRTHCNNGHEFSKENTRFRKDGGRVCKQCVTLRRQRQLSDPVKLEAKRKRDRENKRKRQEGAIRRERSRTVNAEYKRRSYARLHGKVYSELPVTVVEDSLTKKSPLDYLKLNDEQSKLSDDLNFAIDKARTRPPCESEPDRWMFDVDTPPSMWPTAQEAEDMCDGCPFQRECELYAESLRSKDVSGVWGGIRYSRGKRLN